MARIHLLPALILILGGIVMGAPVRAAEPIQVIAVFNLTGPDSALDVSAYDGARLAAEQINAHGGVLARPIELVTVDSASQTGKTAEKVAAALKRHPRAIAGVGFTDNTYALAAGPVFQAAGLPFISPGATGPKVPHQVGDDMFLIAYGDDAQAQVMARFARNELKLSRAAVWINEERDYTRTVGRIFAQAFEKLGGKVQVATFESHKTDFSKLIAEVQAREPRAQAIYAASLPSTAVALIGQVRAAGVEVPLLSGDGWDEKQIVELSKKERIGAIYFTTHRFLDVDTAEMKAFVAAYAKKYGEAPSDAFAPLGFDAVNLLANAIERAGSPKPSAIRSALAATTDFPGLVGDISYAANKRVPDKAVSVIRVDNGVETVLWTGRPKTPAVGD
jgi:branched-chain amino acid transport system substrate-binding protein